MKTFEQGNRARELKKKFGRKVWPDGIVYNPRHQGRLFGADHGRWVENCENGLRLVGFADEINRGIGHKGWYSDNFQDEVMRGVVYRLPARNGKNLFAYGYADPCNEGCAWLCFDMDADDEQEAANHADSTAQFAAEDSREFHAKDMAEQEEETALERIREARERFHELIIEYRQHGTYPAATCAVVTKELRELRFSVRALVRRIRELKENYWLAVPNY